MAKGSVRKKKEKNDKNGSEIKNPEEKTIAKVKMPSAESMAHQKNENFDGLLSQEYDGQISLAVSAKDKITPVSSISCCLTASARFSSFSFFSLSHSRRMSLKLI